MDRAKRKKLFNFRLVCTAALFLAAGIVLGAIFAYFGVSGLYLLIPFVLFAAAIVVVTAKFTDPKMSASLAIIAIAFLGGALYSLSLCGAFCAYEAAEGGVYFIEGRVEKVSVTSAGRTYLIIGSLRADGMKLGGKIAAYLGDSAGDYCEKGYSVSFTTAIYREELFDGGELSYSALNGIKYYCTINGGLDADWGFSLFGAANSAIRRTLFDNTDGETAAVCFALLTGDSSSISEGTLSSFRYGGIAHLFAVSGLHIGVIYGALTLIFKKLPVNRYVSAAIRIAAIVFYSGVCGFTASSVRAVVMCSVGTAATLAYRKNDFLNSLALAAIVLLLINPLYLFGAGFLLSFGAVLGIAMLGRGLKGALKFLPAKLGEALSAGVSAQLGTAATQFACFGYVSWAGLFLNVLIIPVVSALYLLLFACVMLGAIIPPFAAILTQIGCTPVQLLINAVVELGFENAVISRETGLWIYLPFAAILIALSDKFNFKPAVRSTLFSAAAASICLCFILI